MLIDASGKPFSAMVGTFGYAARRVGEVVTRGTRPPDLISGAMVLMPLDPRSTWPPRTAFFTGAEPENGTCAMSTPYESLKSSIMKNETVPTPAAPQLSLPG